MLTARLRADYLAIIPKRGECARVVVRVAECVAGACPFNFTERSR